MKIYSISAMAMVQEIATHYATCILCDTKAEALSNANRDVEEEFPKSDGWYNHSVTVTDVTDFINERVSISIK